jgi:VWFA-related protein
MATADANICAFAEMPDNKRAEQLAKTAAFEAINASSAEMQSTLGVLREALHRTEAAPGSRSIVLVSPGFLTLAPETRQALMELTDRAVRIGITIHTLDIRGLYAVGVNGNVTHPSNPVTRIGFDRDEALAQGEPLAELAYGTGGTYFHNNNDVNEGFRRTAAAPQYIYVLGFSPQKLDGKFHKLKVRLLASNKLTVQARQGYLAEKPVTH